MRENFYIFAGDDPQHWEGFIVLKGRSTRKFILPAFFLFALLLLASCGDQSTFEAKGVVARRQLELFWIIFGLAVLVFVVVEGALIYSAFRFRRRPGQGIPKQTHGHNKLEIAWTIAPALVLIGIAIPTLIVIFNTSASGGVDFTRRVVQAVTDPETEITLVDARRFKEEAVLGELIAIPRIEVTVRAHQWWWEFRYTDFGVETANELRVPANTRIDLKLESDDVIHSFWIPNLMGKTDIIPRNVNETWFVADEPGIYKGQCAEFCGISHANMRFRVIVQTQSDFEKWKEDYLANKTAEATGDAALGQTLFGSKGCTLCHSKDGPTNLEVRLSQREAFLRG
ncbi:MAG: cytochrome c oxidase subunit II, partial [Dehalococcoidia bacterium]